LQAQELNSHDSSYRSTVVLSANGLDQLLGPRLGDDVFYDTRSHRRISKMLDSCQATRNVTLQAIISTSLRNLPNRLLRIGPSNHRRICQPANCPHRPGHNNVFLDSSIFRLHELQTDFLYSYTRRIPTWYMSTPSQLVRLSILHSSRNALPCLQI
jgi:hypothetical protein